jgi:hypothetical protein
VKITLHYIVKVRDAEGIQIRDPRVQTTYERWRLTGVEEAYGIRDFNCLYVTLVSEVSGEHLQIKQAIQLERV